MEMSPPGDQSKETGEKRNAQTGEVRTFWGLLCSGKFPYTQNYYKTLDEYS